MLLSSHRRLSPSCSSFPDTHRERPPQPRQPLLPGAAELADDGVSRHPPSDSRLDDHSDRRSADDLPSLTWVEISWVGVTLLGERRVPSELCLLFSSASVRRRLRSYARVPGKGCLSSVCGGWVKPAVSRDRDGKTPAGHGAESLRSPASADPHPQVPAEEALLQVSAECCTFFGTSNGAENSGRRSSALDCPSGGHGDRRAETRTAKQGRNPSPNPISRLCHPNRDRSDRSLSRRVSSSWALFSVVAWRTLGRTIAMMNSGA